MPDAGGLVGRAAIAGAGGRLSRWGFDLESALRQVDAQVHAVVMHHDWLAPESSLRFLLSKLGSGSRHVTLLHDAALGARTDHFQWMNHPDAVVASLTA